MTRPEGSGEPQGGTPVHRVVLVASSPRFPLLFPPQTWRALDAARPVWLLDDGHPSLPALEVAEIPWQVLAPADDTGPAGRDLLLVGQGLDMEGVALARRQADALLDHARRDGTATLLLPPVHDGPLVQLVADRAARSHIEVEAVYPLGEPKGAALLDLVATETRLRGPDGCPWDREQTHASLARHLVEEAYEVLDAIEEGDPEHLREELGDLLLQVVFHAQLAEDAGDFDVDGVARAIAEKLVRRHPHVFGDLQVASAGDQARGGGAHRPAGRDPLGPARAPARGQAPEARPRRRPARRDRLAGQRPRTPRRPGRGGRRRRARAGRRGAAVRGGRPGQGERRRAGGRPARHRPPLPGPDPGRDPGGLRPSA
jgi:NTP pyrophosphatase (non-canonical NTP hydrolase)